MRGQAIRWLSKTRTQRGSARRWALSSPNSSAGTHSPGSEASPRGRAGGRVVGVLTVIGIWSAWLADVPVPR